MSRQNHIRINQSGATIGIGSVENLNVDQICGSRNSGQATPAQPTNRDMDQASAGSINDTTSVKPVKSRSIAIGVNLNQHNSNPQYNPLENPKTAT